MVKRQLMRQPLQKWRDSEYVPVKSSMASKCLRVSGIAS